IVPCKGSRQREQASRLGHSMENSMRRCNPSVPKRLFTVKAFPTTQRPDRFTLSARRCAQLHSAVQAFLTKSLYEYRNYWFWEHGDRPGTSLGKARPSRDVQLFSKTGEAGRSCAGDRLSCSIGHAAGCGGFCKCAVSSCPMGRSKECTHRRRRDERENPHQLRESIWIQRP